jgi:hypothetical protein
MFIVRSHAVATYIIGQGHEPLDVEFQGTLPIYVFRDEAHGAMASYNNAKLLLAALVDSKRPGGTK